MRSYHILSNSMFSIAQSKCYFSMEVCPSFHGIRAWNVTLLYGGIAFLIDQLSTESRTNQRAERTEAKGDP